MESTGDEQVDGLVRRLAEVSELSPREQLDVFEAVHAGLQGRLAEAEG
ncbi:hypothetical protein [Cellulomonas taurus]|jgi:hypothetical protein|nr:hypothetical protein [Cellulomonas taurus]